MNIPYQQQTVYWTINLIDNAHTITYCQNRTGNLPYNFATLHYGGTSVELARDSADHTITIPGDYTGIYISQSQGHSETRWFDKLIAEV